LDGSGPTRRNARAGAFRIAFEVHEDIDLVGLDARCGLGVRHRADIDKSVERIAKPPAELAAIIWRMRIGNDLEL
jgi:hypothetical protein